TVAGAALFACWGKAGSEGMETGAADAAAGTSVPPLLTRILESPSATSISVRPVSSSKSASLRMALSSIFIINPYLPETHFSIEKKGGMVKAAWTPAFAGVKGEGEEKKGGLSKRRMVIGCW